MGHQLHAVIGPTGPVSAFASQWARARLVSLPQAFALVPVTDALHDDIVERVAIGEADPFEGFVLLSAGVEAVLREASRVGPLAYIETDYFGGHGSQSAVAWDRGRMLAGPYTTGEEHRWSFRACLPAQWAINRVLSRMGVRALPFGDGFASLGLGKYRHTDDAAGLDACDDAAS
jgi:hypothetical protein